MKTEHRFKIDVALMVVMTFCAFTYLLELTPIPASMMVNAPADLSCNFYGFWKSRWGCAQGDISANPTAAAVATLVTIAAFFLLRIDRKEKLPIQRLFVILSAQVGFACLMATPARLLNYFLGYANKAYLVASLPIALAGSICLLIFILGRPSTWIDPMPNTEDPVRKRKLEQSIEAEIAGRRKESSNGTQADA